MTHRDMKGLDNKLTRRQTPEWRALHRDRATAIAVLSVFFACVVNGVAFIGLMHRDTMSSPYSMPIFWFIALPMAWWATSFTEYRPIPVALAKIMAIANIPLAGLLLAWATMTDYVPLSLHYVMTGLVVLATLISLHFYNRSVLKKTGPWRLPEDGPADKPQ